MWLCQHLGVLLPIERVLEELAALTENQGTLGWSLRVPSLTCLIASRKLPDALYECRRRAFHILTRCSNSASCTLEMIFSGFSILHERKLDQEKLNGLAKVTQLLKYFIPELMFHDSYRVLWGPVPCHLSTSAFSKPLPNSVFWRTAESGLGRCNAFPCLQLFASLLPSINLAN